MIVETASFHQRCRDPGGHSWIADFVSGIKAARAAIVARDDDDRGAFLKRQGFSRPDAKAIIETVTREEGRPPESVFDFVQGITAVARGRTRQDARIDLARHGGRILTTAA